MNCPQCGTPTAVFDCGAQSKCLLCGHTVYLTTARSEAIRAAVNVLEHAPDLEALAEVGDALESLARELATCKHGIQEETDDGSNPRVPGVRWCVLCGSWQSQRGGLWRKPKFAREAKCIYANIQKLSTNLEPSQPASPSPRRAR
jgi:hypothetical protein